LDVDRALDLMRQPGLFEAPFEPQHRRDWRIAANQMVGVAVFRVDRRFWCAGTCSFPRRTLAWLENRICTLCQLVVQRSGDVEPERRELGTLAFLFVHLSAVKIRPPQVSGGDLGRPFQLAPDRSSWPALQPCRSALIDVATNQNQKNIIFISGCKFHCCF